MFSESAQPGRLYLLNQLSETKSCISNT